MRKWLALVLILGASAGLWPLLQQVSAFSRGSITFPTQIRYSVIAPAVNSGQIIKCYAKAITVQGNQTQSGAVISCLNNSGQQVPVTFSLDDGAAGAYVTGSGSVTISTSATAQCYSMSFTPVTNVSNRSVTIRVVSQQTDAGLYVDMYFPATVTVKNGASKVTGTCP